MEGTPARRKMRHRPLDETKALRDNTTTTQLRLSTSPTIAAEYSNQDQPRLSRSSAINFSKRSNLRSQGPFERFRVMTKIQSIPVANVERKMVKRVSYR